MEFKEFEVCKGCQKLVGEGHETELVKFPICRGCNKPVAESEGLIFWGNVHLVDPSREGADGGGIVGWNFPRESKSDEIRVGDWYLTLHHIIKSTIQIMEMCSSETDVWRTSLVSGDPGIAGMWPGSHLRDTSKWAKVHRDLPQSDSVKMSEVSTVVKKTVYHFKCFDSLTAEFRKDK